MTKTLEQIKQEASAATDDFFKREAAGAAVVAETSPIPPVVPPVAAEADPAAGAAEPKPKFFADVAQKRSPFSWEKTDGSKKEPNPPDVPPSVAPKPDAEPVSGEKTAEELKTDLDAKRRTYAQLDLDKSRKWARLKNLLGSGIKEVKDEDYDRAWGEYEEAKSKYFEAKRADVLNNRDKEGAREFLREFEGADEAIKFLNLKYDLKKEQSGYPAKILYGFEKLANGWKEMSWKKKLAISVAIMGVGVVATATAGLTFGGVGALAFTLRTAQRSLGAGAMYIGAKKWQDTRAMKKIKENADGQIDNWLREDDWLQRIADYESKHIQERFEFRKGQVEIFDKKHKRRALALAAAIGIGGTAFDMYRQGYFGAIKEKLFGGAAVAEITQSQSGRPVYSEASVTERSHLAEQSQTDRMGGITDQPSGRTAVISDTERPHFAEHSQMDNAAKIQEIAAVKIKAGGNMWVSIRGNIEANPRAYGLDQSDLQFKAKMNGKISEMLHDFAKKNGLSYKQLDKVFEGDNFKIGHDAAGKPYLYDFHGKAFGADVSPGGASAAQEIAPTKAGMTVDDAKPKASVADQQSMRARGGQASAAQEVVPQQKIAQDYQSTLAQANQELAARHPEEFVANARETAMANNRIYLSTRGLWNSVFEGAGFSRHGNVWNSSALEVYNQVTRGSYIADDVSLSEVTNRLNENMVRIESLFKKFGKPPAGMSMGEYFRNITSNSRNIKETIEFINTFKSAPYEELIKPLRR